LSWNRGAVSIFLLTNHLILLEFIPSPANTIQSVNDIGLLPFIQLCQLVALSARNLAACVSLFNSFKLSNPFSVAIFCCHSLKAVSLFVASADFSAVHSFR
jgi:hypothetical protein